MGTKIDKLNPLLQISTKEVIETMKLAVTEGEVDPVKTGVILKKMAKISEEVLKDEKVKDIITNETKKYIEGGDKVVFGATVNHQAVYTFYNFEHCGDPLWNKLDEIEKQVKAAKKDREDYLKTLIPKDTGKTPGFGIKKDTVSIIIEELPKIVVESSGEVIEIKPPIKAQKMGIKYSKL